MNNLTAMLRILSSASKIVFVMMAIGANVAFFMGRLDQNNYMLLCGAAFTFYFSHKGEVQDKNIPFAGK